MLISKKIGIPHNLIVNRHQTLRHGLSVFSLHIPRGYGLDSKDLKATFNTSREAIAMEDLNVKNGAWNYHTINTNGRTVYDYTTTRFITVLEAQGPTTTAYVATPSESTTDITIVKNPTKIRQMLDKLNSDHLHCIIDQ